MTNETIPEDVRELANEAAAAVRLSEPGKGGEVIARAILADRRARATDATEGWRLVPEEPTDKMIGEGDRVMYGRYGCSLEVAPIFEAMLAAAPAAPQPEANAELVEALRLAIEYDDLLRKYQGPNQILFDGDVKEIDEAYDRWVAAARAAIAKHGGRS